MLMSFDMMFASSRVINPDEVESVSMKSGIAWLMADVVDVYEVISYHGLDVFLLRDLDVQVLKVIDVGR